MNKLFPVFVFLFLVGCSSDDLLSTELQLKKIEHKETYVIDGQKKENTETIEIFYNSSNQIERIFRNYDDEEFFETSYSYDGDHLASMSTMVGYSVDEITYPSETILFNYENSRLVSKIEIGNSFTDSYIYKYDDKDQLIKAFSYFGNINENPDLEVRQTFDFQYYNNGNIKVLTVNESESSYSYDDNINPLKNMFPGATNPQNISDNNILTLKVKSTGYLRSTEYSYNAEGYPIKASTTNNFDDRIEVVSYSY